MPDPATIDRIRERLQALSPLLIEVIDDSAKHAGHEGAKSGGGHYRLHLVSARFAGLPRLARHRLVYDALDTLMRRDVHALAMTLLAPDEVRAAPAAASAAFKTSP
ncbi:MAG: BolA family transcriptional regulator [Burkholderiaceae bacterium]|jgi:BolA protein|nr:BolA family transcriptional regulator [Burkholderiaceae bacterium]